METTYQQIILRKFQERVDSNPRYSMRAFARSLSLDPGHLSYLLRRKKKLSLARATEVASALKLSSSEKKLFINLIKLESARTEQMQIEIKKELSHSMMAQNIKELDLQAFATISGWHNNAILELSLKENFHFNAKNIASTLGISETEAKISIDRLLSNGLLKVKNGKFTRIEGHLNPQGQVANQALRHRHREILKKAAVALDKQSVSQREFQSVTMCIDPSLLPEAKQRIQEFAWNLCQFLESKNKKEVYELSLQLFSLESNKE